MSAAWWVVIASLAVGGAFGLGLWVGSSLWWTLWKKWGESIDAHEQTIAGWRQTIALLDEALAALRPPERGQSDE